MKGVRSDRKDSGKPTGPKMGRRGFLATIAAGAGLAALGAAFRIGGVADNSDRTAGPRNNNVSDVTARYWKGGDGLAG